MHIILLLKIPKKTGHLEDPDLHERIILKWSLGKQGERVRFSFIWLRLGLMEDGLTVSGCGSAAVFCDNIDVTFLELHHLD